MPQVGVGLPKISWGRPVRRLSASTLDVSILGSEICRRGDRGRSVWLVVSRMSGKPNPGFGIIYIYIYIYKLEVMNGNCEDYESFAIKQTKRKKWRWVVLTRRSAEILCRRLTSRGSTNNLRYKRIIEIRNWITIEVLIYFTTKYSGGRAWWVYLLNEQQMEPTRSTPLC